MALIDDIKDRLRLKNIAFDSEVSELEQEAIADLILSGVLESKATDTSDIMIKRAIKLYSKANFGLNNPDSEKYQAAYESLRTHLCLSIEYTVEEVV